MKNYKLTIAVILLVLPSCNIKNAKHIASTADPVNNQSASSIIGATLFAKMQMKETIKAGDAVEIKFTVYNNADSARQFCKWHTPFEPLMSKYLTVKDASGLEMLYKGPMAKRMMPPPASSYIKVGPKDSLSTTIDVLRAYDISKPSKYTVIYEGQSMSGLMVKDSIAFNYTVK
jgi:hypothetical protein